MNKGRPPGTRPELYWADDLGIFAGDVFSLDYPAIRKPHLLAWYPSRKGWLVMCQPPQRPHLYQPSSTPLLADATMQAWMAFSSVSYRAAHDLPKKRSSAYGERLREVVSHHRSPAFCLAARARSLRCFFWRFLVIGLLLDMGFPLMTLLGSLDWPIVFAGWTSNNGGRVSPGSALETKGRGSGLVYYICYMLA